ncbi:MAG: hypothetical protein LC117_10410 [Bacteroidia bacterium]|nr:hypothetical protein [Bacteroidia bacterium]
MKKYISLTVVMLAVLINQTYSQKLEKNETDKFTKKTIKATSWEKLIGKGGMSSLFTNFRIQKVDETVWFELKMMMNNKIYSINEKDQIIFLFENDSTLTLYNNESTVACKGCGAPGFVGSEGYGTHTYYLLTKNDIAFFKRNKIKSVRIYNSETYVEGDAEKANKILLRCFELIGE